MSSCDELIDRAQGKVFSCKKEVQPQLKKEHFIEKQYEAAGEIYYRILAREGEDGLETLLPTLEDGYMCVIKNI